MRILTTIFIYLLISNVYGQKSYTLKFKDDTYKSLKKNIETKFRDSSSALNYLRELQVFAIKKGFLTASCDSLLFHDKVVEVNFTLGDHFKNAHLSMIQDDLLFLKKHMRVSEKIIANLPFSPTQIANLLQKTQNTLQNAGYPFAQVALDSIRFQNQELYANLVIHKNQLVYWKEIHIKGDTAISTAALSNLLRIKVGDKFSQEELNLITKRIKQINYLKEIKPHEILFTKEGAELYVYIQGNKISSINGVIGMQPNSVTNKIALTGDIALRLQNSLKKGELIEFNWKSIQIQTQSLKAHLNYPFIFKSPFGIDAAFNFYKRDTSYLESRGNLGIQYFLRGGNYIKFFFQKDASSVLSGGKNNPKFSNLNSVQTSSYGLSILKRQVDYIPNPSRGLALAYDLSVGNRKSRSKNDSTQLKATTYRTELNLEIFVPLYRRHVLRIANSTSAYYAPAIFQNEVYRFGGLTSQRGFNEEELFATVRSTGSLEYRFILDQNSRIFAYFDQSWYENNASKYYNDHPYGFGFGFSFGTNLGIFTISYAQGKQFDNPVLLRNGKVHFGYVAYF